MLEKNQEYIDMVSDFGSNGEGVIRRDNFVVFVPFSIKGEKIRYKIVKVEKSLAYGKLLEVIEPSTIRVNTKCPVFSKCGGCQIQHINYENQVELKTDNVISCFSKIAGLNVEVIDSVYSDLQFGYRNKLQLPVVEENGETHIGFYAENSHRVIPISDCPINPSWTKKIISIFNFAIEKYNLKGYNEQFHSGDIREITVKEVNGNLIITLVLLQKTLKCLDKIIELLDKEFLDKYSLFINENNAKTNVIYGDKFSLIKGKGEYISNMHEITYKIGVQSFMQVNNDICEKLYKEVSVAIDSTDTVIDAYSGAGLMTAILSKKANRAIGIEIVSEAVKCADELKEINGLNNKIINYCGKCEDILPDIIEKERKNCHKVSVVIDPPRKGCDFAVINAIKENDIDKIVYVSCMPSTLARDVGLITGSLSLEGKNIVKNSNFIPRYKIEYIKTFDMFPQTKHIETLCVLIKNK